MLIFLFIACVLVAVLVGACYSGVFTLRFVGLLRWVCRLGVLGAC